MKEIEDETMAYLEELGEDTSERIEAMIDEVEDLEEFTERLDELLDEMGLGKLASALAAATYKARELRDGCPRGRFIRK